MSAFLSAVAREVPRGVGPSWLPASMALVVLVLVLVLVVAREVTRGVLATDREQRARATAAIVVPLVLTVGLAVGARLLELAT
ncbi:MAG: hypothetical protein JWR28_1885 [Modestobacter sp.]|jgi:hypothetical protein|nr:hypothetical protein [Modestobacter sp.]MCW2618736.1 hypothetical protein [Modestobacter sp.]